MLATEASLKAEHEVLKEKLHFTNEDRALMEKAMFVSREQALKEVADMDIGLKLEDMRDYKSDAEETYEKAIDNFYRAEFSYPDLLAYHSKKSLGLLKSLKPPPLPTRIFPHWSRLARVLGFAGSVESENIVSEPMC
ncbi:hypothetical protein Tco_0153411 [Tanacetum coccineum]